MYSYRVVEQHPKMPYKRKESSTLQKYHQPVRLPKPQVHNEQAGKHHLTNSLKLSIFFTQNYITKSQFIQMKVSNGRNVLCFDATT